MSSFRNLPSIASAETLNRRRFIATGTLSGTAVALLAGCGNLMASEKMTDESAVQDVAILNTAIAAEHEAVAAYQVGADSGLLTAGVARLAITFQDHHKQHADALAGAVRKLGGTPAEAKDRYEFPVSQLASESDVLAFAADLERGAVSAYLGAVPLFGDRDLAKAAASILGDEAMHWAVLRQALGQEPVPVAFVS